MSNSVIEKLLRPPFVNTRPGNSEPLTVLFSLLSRADNSPLESRRLGKGHTSNSFGASTQDSACESSAISFENNPNISFEHWGEYWRKVHGVRFTHVEEDDDRSLERLLRYDQLHRFAPGPTSSDAPPYWAPADVDGKLWPTAIGHIERYRRPRWDGVAYLNFACLEDIGTVFANDRIRTKILPEDQAMFRDIAPVLARQHVVIPSASGKDPVTLIKLHVRRKEESRESFQKWWRGEHANFVNQQSGAHETIKRYVQLHNIGPQQEGEPFYHPEAAAIDGVSLMAFACLSDLEDFLLSSANAEILAHESMKTDQDASEYWTTVGFVIVNRINPEVRSR